VGWPIQREAHPHPGKLEKQRMAGLFSFAYTCLAIVSGDYSHMYFASPSLDFGCPCHDCGSSLCGVLRERKFADDQNRTDDASVGDIFQRYSTLFNAIQGYWKIFLRVKRGEPDEPTIEG
jgi:hypothetical protein